MTIQNPESKIQNRHARLIENRLVRIVLGACVFFASAAFFGFIALNITVKHGEEVTVPDILRERGLELRKVGARNNAIVPENAVMSQDPPAGTIVKEGRAVSVTISLGSLTTVVPGLAGKSLREARVELNRMNLKAGRFSKIYHKSEKDTVVSQSPPSGREVSRGASVDMLLSLGPAPREYKLPDFVGLPREKAKRALDAMGVKLGDLTVKKDLEHPQDIVLAQKPAPASLVTEGETVSLVVSALQTKEEQLDRKSTVLMYSVPYGFWSKAVRVDVSDADGTRTIYDEVAEAGSNIELPFGYTSQCMVRVYLDGKLDMERTFR
ncbi:MAG: PASTA domain-containing protein [Candidatus Lindowbacteria bacterium]|nr:PASTA domain-containing protein [Candidatus Lindowbacteria bacterium]